ncbi:hypothetical protein T440DRAFT_529503 [Plenodomus tracheiphilus IPT5]|uniref:Peptidase S8/S53 domain-containing protein n=1 Tax=Plenodomus tracheiphilus IPT5 TaxID=1408161 RepID=A0A6A7B657_9PLEO|nr:hypothetical protein T440DRAFT_529503 [Plenodomus tracheiphilus IPT5]
MRFLSLLLLFTRAASAASMADLWHRDTGVVHDDVEEDKSLGSAPTTRSQSDHIAQLVRRDVRLYTAVATNSTNVEDLEKFVKSKIQPGQGGAINPLTLNGKTFGWANLALDDAAKEEIANHEGVLGIRESLEVRNNQALPRSDWLQKLTRRAGKWLKQEDADLALVVDSQYPGGNVDFDYIYVPDPGKNTFIYVIDEGIHLNVLNEDSEREFVELAKEEGEQVLQTSTSKDRNEKPGDDDSATSHGTNVAFKAAGKLFGVAKAVCFSTSMKGGACLYHTGIKQMLTMCKYIGNNTIRQDLHGRRRLGARPGFGHSRPSGAHGRQGRSVVISSQGLGNGFTHEDAASDPVWQSLYGDPIRKLHSMGVPFVCSAGNAAEEDKDEKDPGKGKRDRIDTFPTVLADDNLPIITIGTRVSAPPDHLTVYAPGESIESQSKFNGQRAKYKNGNPIAGTSLSAPQVAGLIATYLSYHTDKRDWKDKTGVERVKEIRKYIQSDQSSWVRDKTNGIRLIWNGATKEDHDSTGDGDDSDSDNPSIPPSPSLSPEALKTKALSIILQNEINVGNVNKWLFFVVDRGVSPLCRKEKDALAAFNAKDGSNLVDEAPWPGGEYKLQIEGLGGCEYKNGGNDAGALWCSEKGISCKEENMKSKGGDGTKTCATGDLSIQHHPIAYCER